MKNIATKDDLIRYIDFGTRLGSYNFSWKSEIEKLPEYIGTMVNEDKGLHPKRLNAELFKRMLLKQLLIIQPKFVNDENSNTVIEQVGNYFTQDPDFLTDETCSFDKGIFLLGRVGCGKTLLCQGLTEVLKHFRYYEDGHDVKSFWFDIIPSYLLTERFSVKGFEMFPNLFKMNDNNVQLNEDLLAVDDIGAETICNHFGTITNVVGELILRRYDSRVMTYGTTNLNRELLKTFYGERVYSRMIEIFNFLVYPGESRRK